MPRRSFKRGPEGTIKVNLPAEELSVLASVAEDVAPFALDRLAVRVGRVVDGVAVGIDRVPVEVAVVDTDHEEVDRLERLAGDVLGPVVALAQLGDVHPLGRVEEAP